MILLLIHASKFSFSVKEKAIKEPEEPKIPSLEKENVLVVFTTIEKGDSEELVDKAVSEVVSVFNDVKASSVVIYPYAHLSDNLERPAQAISLLKLFEDKMSKALGKEVYRTPFGWYKQFMIDCYGHPLSELSKRIREGEVNYQKSEELKVCEKFGFSSSPHSTFMRRATLEYLRYLAKPDVIIEGEGEPENGEMVISYSTPSGRRLPCINEEPTIKVKTKSEVNGIPDSFTDSKNTYIVRAKGNKGYSTINVNLLTYYYLLNASRENPPTLPLWLSPVQVRIIPVKREFINEAVTLASQIGSRVDIDDTEDGLGSKIARAGKEWIPYLVLLGEREVKTGSLTVKIRKGNEQRSYTADELRKEIKAQDPLSLQPFLPLLVSKRPKKYVTLQ
ncbi:threonyl-tRNA synthetase editing domain-containing protein [Stygiolobus caldivivus]|uniref:Ser-tRNA(Thr) hydrolase n=1 Tax=Stygiolobus caldivivus TaxID=2824673 RepID=A0A8D5U5L5_9CREN|nr:threonyl-tRNA synthetase editing domain-containing protein [Stygiolobus caldivivus]BCU69306.1 Ser-tRNA(Thr) hydrolase [Stygiolobus caldivivus]